LTSAKEGAILYHKINEQQKASTMERMYNVVVINEKTGQKVIMTAYPCTHEEGCTILSKLTDYPWRRKQLEEVTMEGV
jgi:hypothetical protein